VADDNDKPVNLKRYADEIVGGLRNEKLMMSEAKKRQAFYDYEGFQYANEFKRDAETAFNFQGRSHRGSGFLRECIDKLCAHLYSPGPVRRWSESAGDDFLQEVYEDNLIDSLMLEADKLSTLNDTIAIQIDAAEGDFALKPITYRLWGREEIAIWTDPDCACKPIVCCTKDTYDGQTRYRLWSDREVQTFLTKQENPAVAGGLPTAGGRAPVATGPPEPHDYGCLPFSFISYTLPVRGFERVVAPGEFLTQAEIHIDNRLSLLDESIHKHLNPIPTAEGVPSDWKPVLQPLQFIRLPANEPVMGPAGMEPATFAKLSMLEIHIDIAGAWEDLRNYTRQCLEAVGIPESQVRMESIGVASGIALIVEQEPMIRRAKNRRTTFRVYENDLAERTLRCAGNHYGVSALVAAADNGQIALSWPQPDIAVNTPDKLEMSLEEEKSGTASYLMRMQKWYDCSRNEALEIVKQIQEDMKEVAAMAPELAMTNAPVDPQAEAEAQRQHELAMAGAMPNGQANGQPPQEPQ
jgi:hypothetical protein